jgi:hypothetical protein
MRLARTIAPVLCVVVLLVGCTTVSNWWKGAREVHLSPQSNSGESGTATLTKQGDKRTKVVLAVTGAPAGATQPVHIHKGNCVKLDPKPVYALSPLVNGKSETVVNASLDDLRNGGYAINGHRSAQQLSTYVFCGELGK